MILLQLITWPYVRRHKVRTVITVLGIVLGVAVFVGMHTANQSVLLAFSADRRSDRRQDGAAGDGRRRRVCRGRARDRPGAAGGARGRPGHRGGRRHRHRTGEGNLLVLGVDMTGDRSLRDYELERGEDAVDRRSAGVSGAARFADRHAASSPSRIGLRIGSRLPLGTVEGDKQFTVRGIMKSCGPDAARSAATSPSWTSTPRRRCSAAAARSIASTSRVKRGRDDRGARRRELAALLGPGFQVEPPSGRGQQFEAMLARLLDDGEHLEPVRALHRDVHHLQLVRDRGDAAAVARSGSCARSARRARRSAGCFSARAR